jgi:hypothetical protein
MLSFIFTVTFFMFATSQVCCHVWVIVSAFLPTDRMMKHFIFSSDDRTDLQSKPQNLCVINYILIKLHFVWNKPKNIRTFIVPISCMYSVLNQRQIVFQKCVGGKCSKYPDTQKEKWNLVKLPWDLLCLKCYLFRVFMSKEWISLSAKFLLLVYKQMRFWISMFLWSSSSEKHSFLGVVGRG